MLALDSLFQGHIVGLLHQLLDLLHAQLQVNCEMEGKKIHAKQLEKVRGQQFIAPVLLVRVAFIHLC